MVAISTIWIAICVMKSSATNVDIAVRMLFRFVADSRNADVIQSWAAEIKESDLNV